jgi:hypothetical protein
MERVFVCTHMTFLIAASCRLSHTMIQLGYVAGLAAAQAALQRISPADTDTPPWHRQLF